MTGTRRSRVMATRGELCVTTREEVVMFESEGSQLQSQSEDAYAAAVRERDWYFGWLRYRSGSLWPGVFAHACHNGNVVAIELLR